MMIVTLMLLSRAASIHEQVRVNYHTGAAARDADHGRNRYNFPDLPGVGRSLAQSESAATNVVTVFPGKTELKEPFSTTASAKLVQLSVALVRIGRSLDTIGNPEIEKLAAASDPLLVTTITGRPSTLKADTGIDLLEDEASTLMPPFGTKRVNCPYTQYTPAGVKLV